MLLKKQFVFKSSYAYRDSHATSYLSESKIDYISFFFSQSFCKGSLDKTKSVTPSTLVSEKSMAFPLIEGDCIPEKDYYQSWDVIDNNAEVNNN